jgi:hypothetical protein
VVAYPDLFLVWILLHLGAFRLVAYLKEAFHLEEAIFVAISYHYYP